MRSCCGTLVASLLLLACGDDGDTNPSDGGTPDGAPADSAVFAICEDDEDCDNDVYCDGQERCEGGQCERGLPVQCDDGLECTQDRCNEAARDCESVVPDEDGDGYPSAACEDADGQPLGDD